MENKGTNTADLLEQALRDLEASKKAAADKAAEYAPEQERLAAQWKKLDGLSQSERRLVLDAAGLHHVSAAPKPITPIRGTSIRIEAARPQREPVQPLPANTPLGQSNQADGEVNREAAPANEAKPKDKTRGITKQEAVTAFQSIVHINLSKALGDGKGIYGDDGARVRKGTPGGKHTALWDPVVLAIGLYEKKYAPMPKLKKAFFEHPFLTSWLEDWKEKLKLLEL